MTRENINLGSSANDNTGDTLRAAGQKINNSLTELYSRFGGDSGTEFVLSNSTITANGAVPLGYSYYILNKATALALTLANGTTAGQSITFTNKGAGTATITPTSFAQGTSFALAQYDGCQIVWDGTNWYLIGNQSSVTVA